VNDAAGVLGLSAAEIRAAGAEWTAREIAQQPQVWPEIARQVGADQRLAAFLAPLLSNRALRIVLTGAGSSSYIGQCLAPELSRAGRVAEAIPTTDIVASPQGTLAACSPTLMVHFARSGNSPESVATLDLAERQIESCHHLIVTCNAAGELNRRAAAVRQACSLVLPEACNDRSFAMTSSFTGMVLAAALALRVFPADEGSIGRLARLGAKILTSNLSVLTTLVRAQFERVVYLGSNELRGLALESALKMLELTDGKIVSLGESPLGFRHGPKTIVNGSTLVVVFLSNDAYTQRYDLDLLEELRSDRVAGRVIALSGTPDLPHDRDTVLFDAEHPAHPMSDIGLLLPYAVFSQTLALLRSISLGLSPDNPNAAGTVSRVVQGVTLYPFPTAS
jgi:tagatose-6-phosphate ketose/aldose isomerase